VKIASCYQLWKFTETNGPVCVILTPQWIFTWMYTRWHHLSQLICNWEINCKNFKNFTIRGRFSEKKAKIVEKIAKVLQLQAFITPQWLQIAGNSFPNGPSIGCLASIYKIRITAVFPLGCTLRTRKIPTQIFGIVRCLILHMKPTVRCSAGAA